MMAKICHFECVAFPGVFRNKEHPKRNTPENSGFRKRGLANGVSPLFSENETEENGKSRKKTEENGRKRKKSQPEKNCQKGKEGNGKNGRKKRKKAEENGKNRKRHHSGDPLCEHTRKRRFSERLISAFSGVFAISGALCSSSFHL